MNAELLARYDGFLHSALHQGPDGPFVVVERADPRIRVTAEFLDALLHYRSRWASFDEEFLRIDASNRRVIYRVDHFLMPELTYLMFMAGLSRSAQRALVGMGCNGAAPNGDYCADRPPDAAIPSRYGL